MTKNYKPLVVLDDDLSVYKDLLQKEGFKIIYPKDPVHSAFYQKGFAGLLENTQELEGLLSGRIFLTTRPRQLENRQGELNFDLIVIPSETAPERIVKIISEEVQKRSLWKKQACWRLDLAKTGDIRFIKLEGT